MFERFTERARQVVMLAQEEARASGSTMISDGHILLGLLREEEGLAARVLASMDVEIESARKAVNLRGVVGPQRTEGETGQLPFTPRAKKALELSLREALNLGHNYIGTEHILLGLVRENEGTAMTVLTDGYNLTGERVRAEVILETARPVRPQPDQAGGRTRRARADDSIGELMDLVVLLARQHPEANGRSILKAARALRG